MAGRLIIKGGKIYAAGPRPIDTRPVDVQAREAREKIDRLIEELRKLGRERPQLKLVKRDE